MSSNILIYPHVDFNLFRPNHTSEINELVNAFGLLASVGFFFIVVFFFFCIFLFLETILRGSFKSLAFFDDNNLKLHDIKHLAVIMDGNRRYGKRIISGKTNSIFNLFFSKINFSYKLLAKFNFHLKSNLTKFSSSELIGHYAGGEKLIEFADYCIEFGIPILTVYAFSIENWSRPQKEVDELMSLFIFFFEEMNEIAIRKGIYIRFVITEQDRLPNHIISLMQCIEKKTRELKNRNLILNVCISYGSRQELVYAVKLLSENNEEITETNIRRYLFKSITQQKYSILEDSKNDSNLKRELETIHFILANDPDILLRTGGDYRLSNFLLYQSAYSELFYLEKTWPEITKTDFISLISTYLKRNRRFGK